MSDNHYDAVVLTDSFRAFAQQFGPDDVYNRIIIEVLLEELLSGNYNIMSSLNQTDNKTADQ